MATVSGLTNSPFIGLKNFHVAKLLTDPSTGEATYDEVISIPHITSISIKPANNTATLYADNQAVDTASTTSEYELTINTATLPIEYKALLLGHSVDKGVMIATSADEAPYFALMFESTKRNGKKRFCKFYKVQFTEPDESPQTKGQNVQFNTPTITAKAIYRTCDGRAYTAADEEGQDYVDTNGTDWYTTV